MALVPPALQPRTTPTFRFCRGVLGGRIPWEARFYLFVRHLRKPMASATQVLAASLFGLGFGGVRYIRELAQRDPRVYLGALTRQTRCLATGYRRTTEHGLVAAAGPVVGREVPPLHRWWTHLWRAPCRGRPPALRAATSRGRTRRMNRCRRWVRSGSVRARRPRRKCEAGGPRCVGLSWRRCLRQGSAPELCRP